MQLRTHFAAVAVRVPSEPSHYMWNYRAIFSSVLFITDLFGFYLCSFLFLLPHDLTHLFCCWCLRQMSLEVSVRGLEQHSHTEIRILLSYEQIPRKRSEPLSTLYNEPRMYSNLLFFLLLFTQIKSAVFLGCSPTGLRVLSWLLWIAF